MRVAVARRYRFALVLSIAAVLGSALLVERAPATPNACSLITAAQARSSSVIHSASARVTRQPTA